MTALLLLFVCLFTQHQIGYSFHPTIPFHNKRIVILNAKKNKKKSNKNKRAIRTTIGNRVQSSSGFGGAATQFCPCGSAIAYMKCCGKIHKDPQAYANANAEEVVLARYTAYSKREIDFILGSTHPSNKDFMTDIEHWKETIRNNCYDNFELTNCTILDSQEISDTIAEVKFVASMIQVDSREKTAFMETSTFERAGKHIRGGAWLYKSGIVEPVEQENDVDNEENNYVQSQPQLATLKEER